MKVKDLIAGASWSPPSTTESPKVTILLPTYRRAKSGHFARCVDSLLRQTFTDFELIIIDDCSTDGTEDIIKDFMRRDPRVGTIRHAANIGLPAVSSYEGLAMARGEYISFVFDDTELYPNALKVLLDGSEKQKADFVYGYVEMTLPDGANGNTMTVLLGYGEDLSTLLSHNFIPNNAVLAKKSVFDRVGYYDPHLLIVRLCDWDLWRRVLKSCVIGRVEEVVGIEHGPSLSDSLGNTYDMPLWAIEEWMRRPGRNNELSVKNFLEYDVSAVPADVSVDLRSSIELAKARFKGRFWSDSTDDKKRVLVICPDYDASTALYFDEGLPPHIASQVRILKAGAFPPSEVCGASLVIFVRNVWGEWNQKAISMCESLRIPMGYFVDDNFFELAKETKDFSLWEMDQFKERIGKHLKFVLTSTDALRAYFEDAGFSNVLLYPPLQKNRIRNSAATINRDVFTVAFIGGKHRESAFVEHVLPALSEVAKSNPVKLVTHVDFGEIPCVEVQVISRTLSVDQLLLNLQNCGVDLILHPGSENSSNDRYKTLHLLIDADAIGAGLLCSKSEPYIRLAEIDPQGAGLLTENRAWEESIRRLLLAANLETNKRVVSALTDKIYSGGMNIAAWEVALNGIRPGSMLTAEGNLFRLVRQPNSQVNPDGIKGSTLLLLKAIYKRSRVLGAAYRLLNKYSRTRDFVHQLRTSLSI